MNLRALRAGTTRARVLFGVMIAALAAALLLRPTQTTSTAGEDPPPVVYNPAETEWDDYLWPTDAGTKRTSDFAEFRKTHFHAGIDVSTGGQIGYKVFAARDGWLHALSFEPGGYGWFLVLRHYDGYYTCYAHLDRPVEGILNAWYQKLSAAGRSFGEIVWAGDTVHVKRGELIAYTGDTGAGPPHLHFEVRDRDYNPVNPGLSRHLRPVDSLPPEVKGIMLVPLDAGATIDGKWTSKLLTPSGAGSATTVKGLPVLRGRVGILLRAHDRANGATDYPTPYRIRLLVDGKEYFSSTARRFADTLGFHIRIDRDHSLMQAMKGEFRKLYREEGNLLEFYLPQSLDAGVLTAERLGGGRKALRIIAEDLAGNQTSVLMNVSLAFDNAMHIGGTDNRLSLRLQRSAGCSGISLEDASSKGSARLAGWNAREASEGVTVDLQKYRDRTLRVVSTDSSGHQQLHAVFVAGRAAPTASRLNVRREFHFDELVLELRLATPFASPPEVLLLQGGRSERGRVYPLDAARYRATVPAWEGLDGMAIVQVRYATGGESHTYTDSLRMTLVSARRGGVLRSADGAFALRFAPGDVLRSTLYTVARVGADSIPGYRVYPSDIPLTGRPRAEFARVADADHAFVAVQAPMRKYTEERRPGVVTARIGRFAGDYTLLRDMSGPSVSIDVAMKSREPIRIAVRDSLSGVDLASVIARIDGVIVPLQFDERRYQLYVPAEVFKRHGGKELTVSARDRVGNETKVSRKFR
ncbi:MAG: M23 family metallopeptidase [Bacteroidia bacterium]|nr:M23 family metallopeptidase [Bacteroidia bacterium]